MDKKFVYNNEEESEMGQIHAIHLNDDAVAKIRAAIPTGPSLCECEDCGDDIPVERRTAVRGCRRCIFCQERFEKK